VFEDQGSEENMRGEVTGGWRDMHCEELQN